jgi:hypothetical protein
MHAVAINRFERKGPQLRCGASCTGSVIVVARSIGYVDDGVLRLQRTLAARQ